MLHQPLWYKNAVIYCLDVETFQDSNGDGIGDFPGLLSRLDYLNGLGIDCIWLLPFYPTPNRDNGYDVKDYYSVDPRLGNLGEFVEFVHAAGERGIRVLIDLVINHTSIQHPWFQESRSNPDSKYRDYYIWSQEKPADADKGIVFPGEQKSTWTYDEKAGEYYFHRFYKEQPDLNVENRAVQEEIIRIMTFWLELGISGFRLDAAPFVIQLHEDNSEKEKYAYLKEFRQAISWQKGDAIILAEANVEKDAILEYYGNGDKLHMLFNFILNQQLFLALACETAAPLIHGLKTMPDIPETGAWANFLRNHDELSLDKLSADEREFVFQQFGPEENMQIFNRGLRRRLAPMLGNNRRRLELAHSLLFTLPGTPVLRYGEEIGMGEDLSLEGRMSVRTPMQWSDSKNGGFSDASSEDLIRPMIDSGDYAYEHVNVAKQQLDEESLLSWIHKVIRVRKDSTEFANGNTRILDSGNPAVLIHRCEGKDNFVLAVHNLADMKCTVSIKTEFPEYPVILELLSNRKYDSPKDNSLEVELDGYGYRWFRVLNSK